MAQNSFLARKKDAKDPERIYRLRAEWTNKSCNITIFNEDISHAYCGQITEDQMKAMSKLLKWTEEAYSEECKKSLHPDENDGGSYSYEMDGDSFIIMRKVSEKTSMKQILLNIKLKKVDFRKSFFDMFDDAIKQFTETYAIFREMKIENEAITRSYELAMQRLNEMTKLRSESDPVLYTKFLTILNPKKVKITQLQNRIRKLENGQSTGEDEEINFVGSDDSTYGIETDTDEMEFMSDDPSPVGAMYDEPSPSKAGYDELSPSKALCGELSPKQLCVSQSGIAEAPKMNPEPVCIEKEVADKKPSESSHYSEQIFGPTPVEATNSKNSPVSSEKQGSSRSAIEITSQGDVLFDLTIRYPKSEGNNI